MQDYDDEDLTLESAAFLDAQLETFTVCGVCGCLGGVVVLDDVEHVQLCGCDASERTPWPRFDFPTYVDLCHTCGVQLVRSGSRWSSLHCDSCRVWWRGEAEAGRPHVLVGRHTIVNFGLTKTPEKLAEQGSLVVAGVDRLEWHRRELVSALCGPRRVPLGQYLARFRGEKLDDWQEGMREQVLAGV